MSIESVAPNSTPVAVIALLAVALGCAGLLPQPDPTLEVRFRADTTDSNVIATVAEILNQRADAIDAYTPITSVNADGSISVLMIEPIESADFSSLAAPGVLGVHEVDEAFTVERIRDALNGCEIGQWSRSAVLACLEPQTALLVNRTLVWQGDGPNDLNGTPLVLVQPAVVGNAGFERAWVAMNQQMGSPEVRVELTAEDAAAFSLLTQRLVNKRVAIVFDGELKAAPVVREQISGGQLSIALGADDPSGTAEHMASMLAAKPMPVVVVYESINVVSAD